MANNSEHEADLITDHTAIIEVLRAAIYYGDSASIVYLNQYNEINTHFIYNILAKDLGYFNLLYFDKYVNKVSAKTYESRSNSFTFHTDRILSVLVIRNLKGKEAKINFYLNIEKESNAKITAENIEGQLFNPKYTSISNSIYEKNKLVPKPQINNSVDFYSMVDSELNNFLLLDEPNYSQYLSLYKFLLNSFNELKKYILSTEEIFKYEVLFIDKIQALYDKFPEFDKRNRYFKGHRLSENTSKLWEWYPILNKENISYYNTKKFHNLISKCKKIEVNEKKLIPAILKIYSSVKLKKIQSTSSVKKEMKQIFEEYSLHIEVNNKTIEEYYEVVFNDSRTNLVLIRKKY